MLLDPQCLFDQLNGTHPLNQNSCIKVAYSGGVDSTVLLHLLVQLRPTVGFSLVALHVNHGIHVDSNAWENHCAQFCLSLDVAFESTRLQLGSAAARVNEAKARKARYDWLQSQIDVDEVLLTAHHREDQVETFLLNLMRAAGPRGLSAIPFNQKFADGWLTRPLLSIPKSAIIEYARSLNLSYLDDPANENLDHDRNYLRHVVLPALSKRWPAAQRQIASSIEHLEQCRHLIDDLAALDIESCKSQARTYFSTAHPLFTHPLKELHKSRQINVIRYWTRQSVHCEPSRQALDQFIQTALVQDKKFAELAWGKQRLYRYQDSLYLTQKAPSVHSAPSIDWNLQEPINLPCAGIRLIPRSTPGTGLDPEKLTMPVSVRFRQGAERIMLPQRKHSSSLKKLFQQDSIPPWERGLLPLIFSKSELAAVAPWIVAGPFKSNENEPGITISLEQL